jgi:hypothetical protein
MRILFPLIAVAALADIPSADALTTQPAQGLQALAQATGVLAPAAQRVGTRRRGTAHPHAYGYRGSRYPYRGTYPENRLSPPSTAAPMERVPQVAPLAPRVGQ